jgi:hypothetical protein
MGILRGGDAATLRPLLPEPRGWASLLDEAAVHALTPLLHRWLIDTDLRRTLPVTVADRLAGEVFGIAARNMLLAGELSAILRAFEEGQVPCAPLRGPALAEQLYGDVTTRPMGDLDLLVRREDLPRTASILRDLGFEPLDRRPGFAEAFSYTLTFLKDRHGWVIVEPHWTIVYPPFVGRLDMTGVWERCTRERVLDVETWMLGRADLLLHLALHLAHPDGGAPLLWWHELDRLVARDGVVVDWAHLGSVARDTGVDAIVAEVFDTVTALFGTAIPDDVRAQPIRRGRRPPGGRLAGRLAAAAGVGAREELALFFALEGWRARARYTAGLLFPSREFMRVQWGLDDRRALAWGYARRVCRLGATALGAMLRLLPSGHGPTTRPPLTTARTWFTPKR